MDSVHDKGSFRRCRKSPYAADDDIVRLHIAWPQREDLASGLELDAAAACTTVAPSLRSTDCVGQKPLRESCRKLTALPHALSIGSPTG